MDHYNISISDVHVGGSQLPFFCHSSGAASAGATGLMTQQNSEEAEKIIQFQRLEIHRLKQEILGQTPSSRTKLPPLAN